MGKVLLRSAPSAGGDVNGEKPRLYIQFNSSYMLYIYIYIYIYNHKAEMHSKIKQLVNDM